MVFFCLNFGAISHSWKNAFLLLRAVVLGVGKNARTITQGVGSALMQF